MKYSRLILALAALGLFTVLAPSILPQYLVRVVIVMGINIILVSSLGLSNGFTGVFSLGHVGFMALGAYSSGILTLEVSKKLAYLPDLPGFLAGYSLPFLPATFIAGFFWTYDGNSFQAGIGHGHGSI